MLETYDFIIKFTDAYQQYPDDIYLRELACLKVQYPFILQPLQESDLFAGRIGHAPVGFSPQMGDGFAYFLKEDHFQQVINDPQLEPGQRKDLQSLFQFWKQEQTSAKTRDAYSKEMAKILPSDNWAGESGIGFPLYRMSGTQLDYDKLLQLGIPGLRTLIVSKLNNFSDQEAVAFYTGLLSVLDLLVEMCLWYATGIKAEIRQSTDAERIGELRTMAAVLRNISKQKPETMREAIQLMFLTNLMSGSVNYGRMDVYLGDFLADDVKNGRLTEAKALSLLKSLWMLMFDRESASEPAGYWRFDSRVILGGLGRRNESSADRFALLALEATRESREIIPQLTLRFYQGQNPKVYERALEILGEGNPYPMLYNDDVNVPAAAHAFQISHDEALDCIPFGCGEYILDHKSVGTPSGVINLLQALLVTLHHGIDPTTEKPMGLPPESYENWDSFESFLADYKKQVKHYVEILADQEALEYQIAGKTAPFLFFSLLFDDCIERGKAIFNGGVRYLGGTLETYGNSNTADSLLAIKKSVFEERLFSLDELIQMLDGNFEGFESQRKRLENLPKYGNDVEEADAMLVEVDRHVCLVTRDQAETTDLHSYLVVIINNSANTLLGRYTAASPDGRRAFTPMNNGNTPSSGADRSGVTAFLNSILKPDPGIHAGATQNMKFSKDLFFYHREKLKALLNTYWEQGGAQAMLTVVARGELEDAMLFPENYQNLMVRVGGFSARFIELDRDVQEEILARTLY